MSKVNQKEAVYNATTEVLAENGISFEDGQCVKESVTKDMKAKIVDIITEGFINGTVEMSDISKVKYENDPKAMRYYTVGLVNNWFTKDTRLNGGSKYQPKNPGSRAGQGDETLKNLRLLRKQVALSGGSEEAIAKIDAHIDARLTEIGASKSKKIEVNMDLIPDELKDLIN